MNDFLKQVFKNIPLTDDDIIISSFSIKSKIISDSVALVFSHLYEKSFVCSFKFSMSGDRLLVCQNLTMTTQKKGEQATATKFFTLSKIDLDSLADRIYDLKKELFLISELGDQI
jgi:hypothetical protein